MRSADIARLLPDVFQYALRPMAGTFEPDRRMLATLEVMSAMHAPIEAILDGLERFFHARRTPQRFVPHLAQWVDLDWLLRPTRGSDAISDSIASGPDALRKMVETASELAQWRGTARGLQLALETATGVPGFAVEETVAGDDGRPRPFYVRVIVPADAAQFRPLIERVIATEKPAYVVCEVVFSGGAPS
jgi:phage tail-like protein